MATKIKKVWCVFSEQYREYKDGFGTHIDKNVKVCKLLGVFATENAAHRYIGNQSGRFFNYRLPNCESPSVKEFEVQE